MVRTKRLVRLEEDSVSRARHGKGDVYERLEQLYGSVDEVQAFVLRYTPCRRGCCGCCHYKVNLFGIEATYLERSLGIQREPPLLPLVETHGLPCPFLWNNECTIYQHRPYACRKHLTLDASAYWCQPDRANTATLILAKFSKVEEAIAWLAHESGERQITDIRNFFPSGLRRKSRLPPNLVLDG